MYDADGHELLDYTLAWGLLIAGSCHPRINAAVRDQLRRSYAVGAGHELEVRLAERLTGSAAGGGPGYVRFLRQRDRAGGAAPGAGGHRRDKILKFEGHYHGWMNNVLVSHPPPPADVGAARPVPALAAGQPAAEYADTLVAPWNDLDALRAAFAAHGDEIACVITEPLLANSGCCEPRPLLGRPAGDRPCPRRAGDLRRARAAFAPLLDGRTVHSGSNNGSPVAVAAALATLEVLSEPDTYDTMHAHGRAIRRHLEQEASRLGVDLVTCGAGSVFSVHFGLRKPPRCYADTLAADATAFARFPRPPCCTNGIYLLPDGRWYVGATHTDRELQRTLPAITAALQHRLRWRLTGGGGRGQH
ncbi:Glutamate-1-semialdehyde 2,1-aminomutase [Geodia barretti]|uniref:Glutamate-1-semialdehyde 2,1-aminomutase n=1 Tax=Geodia barretti TaxID=519541 RepID=A0AA35SJI5_GEOBA|nr:Glutamate-1-semialdehyde 2,1-aminomutase [Geodia barretti]